jgi:hypothetical protein
MSSTDDVLRAQARALIHVLAHYQLYRALAGAPELIFRAVEAYGTASDGASDLPTIHREFYHVALAASSIGLKHRAANAPLFLALHSFSGSAGEYRFLQPAWWMAVTIAYLDEEPVPEVALHAEVLERLEAAFDVEMAAEAAL